MTEAEWLQRRWQVLAAHQLGRITDDEMLSYAETWMTDEHHPFRVIMHAAAKEKQAPGAFGPGIVFNPQVFPDE